MKRYSNTVNLKNFVINNRKESTKSEKLIWNLIRNKKMGTHFRRQHQIGKYIVDFVSIEKKLIIEIDGGQHNYEQDISCDEKRTSFLNKLGFKVMRFWNSDVLNNLNAVYDSINKSLNSRPHPSPLPDKGEGGKADKK